MKMAVSFILENRSLLQISFVSGVRAQHAARKSDRLAGLTVGRYEETQKIFVEMALDGRRGDAVVTVRRQALTERYGLDRRLFVLHSKKFPRPSWATGV